MRKSKAWVGVAATLTILASAAMSEAQVNLRGKTRLSFSGLGTISSNSSVTAIAGASRFTESGLEFGGDVWTIVNDGGASGTVFVRVGQNFIGESRTVPFVSAGAGVPFGSRGRFAYDAGGGMRRFTEDGLASFDVMAGWQGYSGAGGKRVDPFRSVVLLRRQLERAGWGRSSPGSTRRGARAPSCCTRC